MSSKRHSLSTFFFPLAALIPLLASCGMDETREGDVFINSARTTTIENGAVLTLEGQSQLPDTATEKSPLSPRQPYVHVIILYPPNIRFESSGGSGSHGANPWQYAETLNWRLQPDGKEQSLKVTFDGREKMVEAGGKRFALRDGSYFLVKYDQDWQPTIEASTDIPSLKLSADIKAEIESAVRDE